MLINKYLAGGKITLWSCKYSHLLKVSPINIRIHPWICYIAAIITVIFQLCFSTSLILSPFIIWNFSQGKHIPSLQFILLLNHIFISVLINGCLFYSLDYNPILPLFISLIKLFQLWPLRTFSDWILCHLDIPPVSSCIFSVLSWNQLFLQRAWLLIIRE